MSDHSFSVLHVYCTARVQCLIIFFKNSYLFPQILELVHPFQALLEGKTLRDHMIEDLFEGNEYNQPCKFKNRKESLGVFGVRRIVLFNVRKNPIYVPDHILR